MSHLPTRPPLPTLPPPPQVTKPSVSLMSPTTPSPATTVAFGAQDNMGDPLTTIPFAVEQAIVPISALREKPATITHSFCYPEGQKRVQYLPEVLLKNFVSTNNPHQPTIFMGAILLSPMLHKASHAMTSITLVCLGLSWIALR